MRTLTALIPFFNEERTIAELVNQLSQLPKGTLDFCLFVDDGSTDKSMKFLEESLRKTSLSYSIISKVNEGKASAIREASQVLETSHVVILDADLELDVFDIVKMWEVVLQEESEIVFGYREFRSQSAFTYRFVRGNQFISNLYGILFNEVITDIMCGFKLLPTNLLREFPFRSRRFAIEIEIPLQMWLQRLRPHEIPVEYRPRSREEGKIIGLRDAFQIILYLIFFRITMARKRIPRQIENIIP